MGENINMIDAIELSPRVGSEVRSIDLKKVTSSEVLELVQILSLRGVLIFKNQFLNGQQLGDFAANFGKPWLGPLLSAVSETDAVVSIRNRGKEGTVTEYWHSDSTFVSKPPAVTMLSTEDIPPVGGDTMWCSQYAIYDEMSDGLRQMLSCLKGVHYDRQRFNHVQGRSPYLGSASHPLIRTHPVSKMKSLFISGQVEHFEGMTHDESRPLIDYLLSLLGEPDKVYRHRWTMGDVVIWDNRCTTHYAIHDHGLYPRRLHRITLEGEEPN
jgi:taurine dioxygenase